MSFVDPASDWCICLSSSLCLCNTLQYWTALWQHSTVDWYFHGLSYFTIFLRFIQTNWPFSMKKIQAITTRYAVRYHKIYPYTIYTVYSGNITLTSQWARWLLKPPASRLFTQLFIQAQINENIKASRHWPLLGEFTGDRWIPRTKGQ